MEQTCSSVRNKNKWMKTTEYVKTRRISQQYVVDACGARIVFRQKKKQNKKINNTNKSEVRQRFFDMARYTRTAYTYAPPHRHKQIKTIFFSLLINVSERIE